MLEAVIRARFARGPGHEYIKKNNWLLFYADNSFYVVGQK
jgi:hypothetical protein